MRASLRRRLLTALLLPTLLALAVVAGAAWWIARGDLEAALGERLTGLAQAAATSLDPADLAFLAPGDEASRTARRVRDGLAAFARATGLRRVVVVDPAGRALADSQGAYPIGAPVPDLARDRLEFQAAVAGRAGPSQVLFVGQDGRPYKSGYAPVRSGDGTAAVVLVDGSAAYFARLQSLGGNLAALVLLAVAALVGAALVFSRSLTRPLARLVAAARRIGDGDLGTPVPPGKAADEVHYLARTLEEMRQRLARRDEALQTVLGGIAHEVRNPLGGVALFTGLLAEELADAPEALGHVRRIQQEMDRLETLVERFLDYARVRALEVGPVPAATLLREVAVLCGPAAEAKGVTVTVAEPSGPDPQGDPDVLKGALLNLARNAVEAAPPGGRVTLGAQGAGPGVQLWVEDDGPGVPREVRDRIFEPFFTTRAQGSGLGLALARKAAVAHRGVLRYRTAAGGGARFELEVPRAPQEPAAPRAP